MRLVICLALVVVACAVEPETRYHELVGIPAAARIRSKEEKIQAETSKIVGGAVAPVNAYPYLAGLVISFVNLAGTSACGSSLISTNRLVTAAHCWRDTHFQASQFIVVLGSQFLFSGESIQPVSLPHSSLWDSFDGQWALAAGYGKTSDAQVGVSVNSVVSHVDLQVIPLAWCQAVFGAWAQPSNICTNGFGGVGICGGDSGGPLVVYQHGQPVLVGISSFVAAAGRQLGHPSAFVRVTSFYSFILQNM